MGDLIYAFVLGCVLTCLQMCCTLGPLLLVRLGFALLWPDPLEEAEEGRHTAGAGSDEGRVDDAGGEEDVVGDEACAGAVVELAGPGLEPVAELGGAESLGARPVEEL